MCGGSFCATVFVFMSFLVEESHINMHTNTSQCLAAEDGKKKVWRRLKACRESADSNWSLSHVSTPHLEESCES